MSNTGGKIGEYAGKTRYFGWQEWVTEELKFREERPVCDKCGGEGTLEPAAPTAANIIRSVFGRGTSPDKYEELVRNPSLDILRNVQAIRGGTMYDTIAFFENWAEQIATENEEEPRYVPLNELG